MKQILILFQKVELQLVTDFKTLTMIKLAALLLLSLALSCNSTKSNIETTTETKVVQTDFEKEGYSVGIIQYNKDSSCEYIIINEISNSKFDPINIDEEKFAVFKENDSKIYFKYESLRRMNRCSEAAPIKLIDIKKRED